MRKCSLDKINSVFEEITKTMSVYLPADEKDGSAVYKKWEMGKNQRHRLLPPDDHIGYYIHTGTTAITINKVVNTFVLNQQFIFDKYGRNRHYHSISKLFFITTNNLHNLY